MTELAAFSEPVYMGWRLYPHERVVWSAVFQEVRRRGMEIVQAIEYADRVVAMVRVQVGKLRQQKSPHTATSAHVVAYWQWRAKQMSEEISKGWRR